MILKYLLMMAAGDQGSQGGGGQGSQAQQQPPQPDQNQQAQQTAPTPSPSPQSAKDPEVDPEEHSQLAQDSTQSQQADSGSQSEAVIQANAVAGLIPIGGGSDPSPPGSMSPEDTFSQFDMAKGQVNEQDKQAAIEFAKDNPEMLAM